MKTCWRLTQLHDLRSVTCWTIRLLIAGCFASPAHAEDGSVAGTRTNPHHLLDGCERLVLSLQKQLATPEAQQVTVAQTSAVIIEQAETTSQRTPQSNAIDSLEHDPLAAERALERTLTQSGALLLPAGQAELLFSTSYARTQQQSFITTPDQPTLLRAVDLRRNDYGASLSTRIGLPFDAQAELTVPYRFVAQSIVVSDGQNGLHALRNTAAAMGDVSVGVAKTLMHEQRGWPDMIGRLAWNVGNGREAIEGVAIGDGFKKIRGELTLLKRADPLVFTGTMTLESTLKKHAVKPGDAFGLSLSALLATSPDTSLSVGLDQVFTTQTRVRGVRIVGSDQVSGALTFGASTIIGNRTLLSVTVGKNLTKSAPDYFVNIALPFRFDLFK